LLRPGIYRYLLLAPLKILDFGLHLPLLAQKFPPPPKIDRHQGDDGKNGQDGPHGWGK
jgi:hypothetical protein